jgi:hypothetical protein
MIPHDHAARADESGRLIRASEWRLACSGSARQAPMFIRIISRRRAAAARDRRPVGASPGARSARSKAVIGADVEVR